MPEQVPNQELQAQSRRERIESGKEILRDFAEQLRGMDTDSILEWINSLPDAELETATRQFTFVAQVLHSKRSEHRE
jgi:hypothetical protein